MNEEELALCYWRGTDRACQAIEKLYEDLHKKTGDPNINEEEVIKMVQECIRKVRSELDIIKTAVNEYSGTEIKYKV